MLLCVHTRYNLFAHSSCTSLFILIFIKSTVDCVAHFISLHILLLILFYFILFYFIYFFLFFILFLPIFIYILLCYVSFFILFFSTVHWADLSWPTFHYWLYPVWLCMWQIIKNLEPWTILKTFYSGTIESVLTQCISVWYGNSSSQDCKALQRVVRLAERISGSALPSLQDIYLKRCRSRAVKIIKDSNHPGNCLLTLLPSGKRFRSLMAKTERLRRSFFPQAIRLLNSNSAS